MSEEKKYCLCGCGAEVRNKWKQGHHSRVINISKRADIRKKRAESMKKRHADGVMPEVWNKGKTKETDERLAKAGQTWKDNLTPERRKKIADSASKQFKEGRSFVHKRGAEHPRWKGGSSSITQRVRGSHQLYKWWKYPKLKAANFSCQSCSHTGDLIVHHYEERMADIIQKFMPEDRHVLTWDEETEIAEDIVAYHLSQNVPGVVLCSECHDLVHNEERHSCYKLSESECMEIVKQKSA